MEFLKQDGFRLPAFDPYPDYSVTQVCTKLNVTAPTVYKLINTGKLDSYTIGRSRRITHESIERLRKCGDKNESGHC